MLKFRDLAGLKNKISCRGFGLTRSLENYTTGK